MPEAAPLRDGDPRQLGGYTLLGLLGEGGQGAVYLAEDEPGHHVAVKLLHARFSGDARARQRFAAELEVARRVAAFCTARVLAADVEGDRPYIVSEYIDGPSLARVLAERGPRSGADLDRLAIGTMTALAAIHEAGVAHRDFKPGNVLLAADGPRVIDFGIARALDATGTLSSTAVGTPAYMAPEQISGAPVGPAADVFAWGTTMVAAATGRPAFGQDSIPAVMHRVLNLPPDLGALPEPLRSVVFGCLDKDPARRPTSQQVLIRLLGLAGSLPLPAASPQPAVVMEKGVLDKGAQAAVTGAFAPPPTNPQAAPPVPNPWPPAPPSYPAPQAQHALPGTQQTAPGGGKPSRRGLGILVGAGSAAAVALVVGAGFALANLGGREDDPPVDRTDGELTMVTGSIFDGKGSLSPAHATGGPGTLLAKQLFTGLTETTPTGGRRDRLATSISPDATCTNWEIKIREGTRFTNGEPVDAEAFARGWSRSAQNPLGAAGYLMRDVKGYSEVYWKKSERLSGVRAAGQTLTVDLTGPDCEFPWRLSNPAFFPAPQAAGKADNAAYNDNPIGNGPFRVSAYTKNQSVQLVRNDSWAFGRPKLARVRVDLVSDPNAAQSRFASGEVGWVSLNDPGAQRRTAGMKQRVEYPTATTRFLVPLTWRGPMKNKQARQAVNYAVDRTALATALGYGRPATSLVPPPVPGSGEVGACDACTSPSPDIARKLAGEAGLGSGTTVPLHYVQNVTQQPIVQALKAQLENALGWKIELKGAKDLTEWRKTITRDDAEGLSLQGWLPDYPTAHSVLHPLLSGGQVADGKNGLSNFARWKNAEFDGLLDRARRTTDTTLRAELTERAERLAVQDGAVVPLLFGTGVALRSDRYDGLGHDYDGDPTLAEAAQK